MMVRGRRLLALVLVLGLAREGLAQDTALPACVSGRTPVLAHLTLDDALRQIVCVSPSLRRAGASVDEQRGGLASAKSTYLPRVNLQGEIATNQIPGINSAAGYLSSSASAGLGFNWLLIDYGARSAANRQANQGVRGAESARENTLLLVFGDALKLYTDAITAQSRREALAQAVEIARQTLAVVEARKNAQASSLVEVLQARTALSQAEVDHGRAVGTWGTARGVLALAMGYPASQALVLAPTSEALAGSRRALAQDGFSDETLEQHPLLRSLRADIDAAKARVDQIRAEAWGTISLSGTVSGTQSLQTSSTPYSQISTSVALLAAVPLFDGGDRDGRLSQAVAQMQVRTETFETASRELKVVIHTARQAVETESINAEGAKTLLAISTDAYDVAHGRYKSGVGSLTDLLTAQNAVTSARLQLAQAEITLASARVNLAIAEARFTLD